jgi:taurine dioxygenase
MASEHTAIPSEPLDPARAPDFSAWARGADRHGPVRVEPLSPVLGGRVLGFSPALLEDQALRRFLYEQILARGVLVFAPGSVDAASFAATVGLFGDPSYFGTPHTPPSTVSQTLNAIDSRTKKTRANYIWHIDQAYQPQPTRFTALYAEAAPDAGGDTVFANAAAAFELLPPGLAAWLETLTVIQSFDAQGFLTYAYGHDPEALARQRLIDPPVEMPLIRVHPETGRKQIFANELYTTRIVGLSPMASQAILALPFDAIKAPEVQFHLRWEAGSAVIWDNRLVHTGASAISARNYACCTARWYRERLHRRDGARPAAGTAGAGAARCALRPRLWREARALRRRPPPRRRQPAAGRVAG